MQITLFETYLSSAIEEEQQNLTEFKKIIEADCRKLGLRIQLVNNIEETNPYFIIPLNQSDPVESDKAEAEDKTDDGKPPLPEDKKRVSEVEKLKIPWGIKISYVLGTLTARLVNNQMLPIGLSVELHSKEFDSQRGVNIENFKQPLRELAQLINIVKHKDKADDAAQVDPMEII